MYRYFVGCYTQGNYRYAVVTLIYYFVRHVYLESFMYLMEITHHGYRTSQPSLEDIVWFQSLSHRCNVPRMCSVERSERSTGDHTNRPNSSSSRSPHYTHNVPKSHSSLCSTHYSLVRTSADGKSYCHP